MTPRRGWELGGQAEQDPAPRDDPGTGRAAQQPIQASWIITLAILEDALKIFSTSKLWRSSLHFASSNSLHTSQEEQVWLAVGSSFRHCQPQAAQSQAMSQQPLVLTLRAPWL